MYRGISKQHVQRHIKGACTEAYQSSMYRGISKQHVQRHIRAAYTEAYQSSMYTVQKHVQRHIKEATSLKASTVLSRTRKQKNREQNLSPLSSLPP